MSTSLISIFRCAACGEDHARQLCFLDEEGLLYMLCPNTNKQIILFENE